VTYITLKKIILAFVVYFNYEVFNANETQSQLGKLVVNETQSQLKNQNANETHSQQKGKGRGVSR